MIGVGVGPFVYKLLTGRYGATPAEAGIGITVLLVPSTALGIFIGKLLPINYALRQQETRLLTTIVPYRP